MDQGRFVIDESLPGPTVPVVEVAADEVRVPLSNGPPPDVDKPLPLQERWYNYSVGLLLQQDAERARTVFHALPRKLPDFVNGYVGLGRVVLLVGDPEGAVEALMRARALAERPTGAPALARSLALRCCASTPTTVLSGRRWATPTSSARLLPRPSSPIGAP